MKQLKLPKETIEVVLNGATKIVLPIDEKELGCVDTLENYLNWDNKDVFIENYCPIQLGKEFAISKDGALLKKSDFDEDEAILIDKKFYHISDFVWHEVSCIEVKRYQDYMIDEKISKDSIDWLSYKRNDYVFIADIKEVK